MKKSLVFLGLSLTIKGMDPIKEYVSHVKRYTLLKQQFDDIASQMNNVKRAQQNAWCHVPLVSWLIWRKECSDLALLYSYLHQDLRVLKEQMRECNNSVPTVTRPFQAYNQ